MQRGFLRLPVGWALALFLGLCLCGAVSFAQEDDTSVDGMHEMDLARGLVQDFQFFELAHEVIERHRARLEAAGDTEGLKSAAIQAVDIYGYARRYWSQVAQQTDDDAKRAIAEQNAETAKTRLEAALGRAGGGLQAAIARLNQAKQQLEDADTETDSTRKAELREQAASVFEQVLPIFRDMFTALLAQMRANPNQQLPKKDRNDLRLSWYYYCECLYQTGRTESPIDRDATFNKAVEQLDELIFEFEDEFVAYYAQLLQGDIELARRPPRYGKATAQYEGVYGGIPKHVTKATELRLQAYFKTAQAYLKWGKSERAIETINLMLADYPDKKGHRLIKTCRIIKAEAEIRSASRDVQDVIKDLDDLRNDPDDYFRSRYNEMLGSIGKFPGLATAMRRKCARSAFSSGKYMDAIHIYQIILTELKTKAEFERYGPEAYWQIAECYLREWRFMEAGIVLKEAARRFFYFDKDKQFAGTGPVPRHAAEFDKFTTREVVRGFGLECAKRSLKAFQWSPAQKVMGGAEFKLVESARRFKDDALEASTGKDMTEVWDKWFRDAWAEYQRQQKLRDRANYHKAIVLFLKLPPRYKLYKTCAQIVADLMRRMAGKAAKLTKPFAKPESADLYQHELTGLTKGEFCRTLPEAHKERLMRTLEQILTPEVQQDVRLLYWFKARYFMLRYLSILLTANRGEIDIQVWQSGTFGDLVRALGESQQRALEPLKGEAAARLARDAREISYAIWYLGEGALKNPWSEKYGYLAQGADEAQLAQFKKKSEPFKRFAAELWIGYAETYAPFFQGKGVTKDEQAKLQSRFDKLVRGVMYFLFYIHLQLDDLDAAAADITAFERAFPPEKQDAQLKRWHLGFLERIPAKIDDRNRKRLTQINMWVRALAELVDRLKSGKKLTLDELHNGVDLLNLPRADFNEILKALEREDEVPRSVRLESIDEFGKRVIAEILAIGPNAREIMRLAMEYSVKLTDLQATELYEECKKLAEEKKDTVPTDVMRMYNGYLQGVFTDRYAIATVIQEIMGRYLDEAIALDGRSLNYSYRFWAVDRQANPDKYTVKELYTIAKRFYNARQFARAVEYLEQVYADRGVQREFKETIVNRRRGQATEVGLRSRLGLAYYYLAQQTNDPKHWDAARQHMDRIYRYVDFMNTQRRKGYQGPIDFQKAAESVYYEVLAAYIALLDRQAATEVKAGQLVKAYDTIEKVALLWGLLSKQAAEHSPDEREGIVKFCETRLRQGELAETPTGSAAEHAKVRPKSLSALDGKAGLLRVVDSLYMGNDHSTYVLRGAPQFDKALDDLYKKAVALIRRLKAQR